ncbi:MAG TPA: hypothetical protein VGS13_13890, partial [Stellaceae bacterium]|nr:hypothetical protein [Stellaceae bacterium]
LESGAVVSVLQDWLLPPVDLWAAFPAGRQANAKARAFATFIQLGISNSGAVKERPEAARFEDRELLNALGEAGNSANRMDHLAAAA